MVAKKFGVPTSDWKVENAIKANKLSGGNGADIVLVNIKREAQPKDAGSKGRLGRGDKQQGILKRSEAGEVAND